MPSISTLLSWGPDGWLDDLCYGAVITLLLALATLPFGLIVGFLVALAKKSTEPSLRLAGNIYTTIFRGLPELLTLFLVYFGAQIGLQSLFRLFNPEATIEINAFIAGMIALTVVNSSYSSEVFLSAFRAIPPGQYEGGYSLGLSGPQTMRLVVLPQLLRIVLPGLANLWMVLLKDTALVSAVGLAELTRQATVASRVTKHAFLFFGIACALYLLITILSSLALHIAQRRLDRPGTVR